MQWRQDEDSDPTPADEGKFIPDSELLGWWSDMQTKFPQIYKADDKLFGNETTQHAMGTKLMTFF